MKKIYLSTVIALAMHSFVNAQDIATINDIKYYLEEGEATVMAQSTDLSGDIVIPETVTYNGTDYKVKSMTDEAFKKTSITIRVFDLFVLSII